MSDDYQHIDVNDEQWSGTPRELREALDKAQKTLKERDRQISEFQTERVNGALSGVLTGFKNPGKVKADILRDKVDPLDSEAVTKWLESNGDDYARGEQTPVETPTDQPDPRADRAKLEAVAQIGTPGTANIADVIASVPKDLSPTETRAWLIQHGA